ncbi:MAG: carbohydrate porin [Tenuifilaceae bacterium]
MSKLFCINKFLFQLLAIVFTISLSFKQVHAQEKSKLSEAVEFGTTVTGDFISNMKGGIKKGETYIGMESLTFEFNTEKAGLWKNGTFFLHGLNAHGTGPSSLLTGDHQVLSNIEAGDYTGLYEFWYSHQINKFSILLGQHDLNSEFVGTEYGGTFVNSSFGIAPSISLNVPVSIYPVAAPSILLKYESGNKFDFKLGIYDGDPGNFETNRFNLKWSISPGQGFFGIGEVQYNLIKNENLTGTYKLGSYYHTGKFNSYEDTLKTKNGNYGIYFIADQALFSRSLSSARGLCFFLQSSIAPSKYNMVEYYIGGGLRYHGILPYRYYDELGLAFAHISMSKYYTNLDENFLNYETSIEFTYKFQFDKRYSIQPSMQYIINPGTNKEFGNCLVGLMRFSLSY